MTVTAHTLVKNEARFVWYAVTSAIEYVDRLLLWDTGSTDDTKEICKEIRKRYKNKVDLRFLGSVTIDEFANTRALMLEETKTDWFLVLDGDEVWWDDSIRAVRTLIDKEGKGIESIVVPTVNMVGDMFHCQEPEAGKYNLAGRVGHLSLRGVNRLIPGLSSSKPHGTWGWTDIRGKMIQDRDEKKIRFVDAPYLHASFLPRAGKLVEDIKVPKRAKKRKYELGQLLPKNYYYPEAFFRPRPSVVSSVWEPMNRKYYCRALIETPLRKFKRRYLPEKVGY